MHWARKWAIVIIVAYALLFAPAGYCAFRFFGNTKLVYKPPTGSIVDVSERNAAKFFASQILDDPLFLLVTNIPRESPITANEEFRNFTFHLQHVAETELARDVQTIQAYWLTPSFVPQFRDKLVGGVNNDTSLISISVREHMTAVHDRVMAVYAAWKATRNATTFTLESTSVDSISADLESGILLDLAKIDAISMPIAFCCLAYCLGSLRMLIIPGITVVCTIIYAFAFMFFVSLATTMSSFAPEMSAAVMSSVGIDYALFVLTRFVDQVRVFAVVHGRNDDVKWRVVRRTTELSAHNILVSGLTIAAALGGLGILPVPFIATIGIAFCIGAVVAVVVALTLMPALLLVFYDFFAQQAECGALKRLCGGSCGCCFDVDIDDMAADERDPTVAADCEKERLLSTKTSPRNTTPTTLDQHAALEQRRQYASVWFKIGYFTFHHPYLVAFAVLAAASPFFYFATELRTNFDLFDQVPRDSPHAAVLKRIVDEIGHGSTTPFYVTFTTDRPGGLMNDTVFSLVNNVTREICNRTGQPLDRVLSFAYVPGLGFIDSSAVAATLLGLPNYRYLFNMTVDSTQQAGLIGLFTTFDPFSSSANGFLNDVYDVLRAQPPVSGVELGLLGASADSWAIMRKVMELFPLQIGVTFSVIFVFIAIVFRSLVIPLRMVVTVAYTVGLSFGLGVLLYQYSWSHTVWTAMRGVTSYSWTVPIFSFSLLTALSLDYDIFLLTRIIEFKTAGFTTEAAISKSVWKTGRVVSFAGLIMCISFGSLAFSNTTMLNQFGAIASVAVLIDTFVVRPLLVPALMSILPGGAFWPRRFAREDRGIDDVRELPDGAAAQSPSSPDDIATASLWA